jgi:hypothetical protein
MTHSGHSRAFLSGSYRSRHPRRLELLFERRDPAAAQDCFEFRVRGGSEARKSGKHGPFVCIEIVAKAANRIC